MKKVFSKVMALLMAACLCVGMCATAFAADGDQLLIKIEDAYSGETYTAYKVLDATYSDTTDAVSYTINSSSPWFSLVSASTSTFTVEAIPGQDGVYAVTAKSGANADTVAATLSNIPSGATAAATGTADISKREDGSSGWSELVLDVTSSGAGYYYVTTSVGSLVSINTVAPTVYINDKNTIPTLTKEEVNETHAGGTLENGVDSEGSKDTAKSGDIIEYEIIISNAEKKSTLTLHDSTTKGLTFNGNIKVHQNTVFQDVGSAYYSIDTSCDDGCDYEITFAEEYLASLSSTDKIIVTYEAYVNENVESQNYNDAYLTYGQGGISAVAETETDSFGFTLEALDATGNHVIDGAVYQLAYSNGTLVQFYMTSDGHYVVYDPNEHESGATTEISAGTAVLFGLDTGTYTLTEIVHPDGYIPMTNTVEITISNTGNITTSGTNIGITNGVVGIIHTSGTAFPSTGGTGTIIMCTAGGLLLIGAIAAVVVNRKRMA